MGFFDVTNTILERYLKARYMTCKPVPFTTPTDPGLVRRSRKASPPFQLASVLLNVTIPCWLFFVSPLFPCTPPYITHLR
eukprot:scaffold3522_cov85-Skeletonema_marinoi.AAC.1